MSAELQVDDNGLDTEHATLIKQLGLHLPVKGHKNYYRFSESPLWPIQRQYFNRMGVNATRRFTSSAACLTTPFNAEQYAAMVISYWEDALNNGHLNPDKPVYILEQGAASGQFAWLFIAALVEKLSASALPPLQWTFLVSDMVEANLDFVAHHPSMSAYVEDGYLDTVLQDVESSAPLYLRHQQRQIEKFDNPPAVIANALFGCLTQELLHIHFGKLFEGRVALIENPEDSFANMEDGVTDSVFLKKQYRLENPFEHLTLDYDWREVEQADWLSPQHVMLLPNYIQRLDSTCFSVPTGALRAIDHLLHLSQGRLFLLMADEALCSEQDLRNVAPPQLHAEGGFSLPVNYHLLEQYIHSHGGLMWQSRCEEQRYTQAAVLFAEDKDISGYGNTQSEVHKRLGKLQAADMFEISQVWTEQAELLNPRQMLACLRLSNFDINVLAAFLPQLLKEPLLITSYERLAWCEALERVCRNHFYLGGEELLLFDLGLLAVELMHWPVAEEVFSFLVELSDENIAALSNLALVYSQLGELDMASRLLDRVLALDPECEISAQQKTILDNLQQQNDALLWNLRTTDGELCLQPLSHLDARAFYYQYRDPNIAALTRLPDFENQDMLVEWIEKERTVENKATFAIVHQHYGFIGVVSLRYHDGAGYFYFWVGSDFQNRGFGQHATKLLFEHTKKLGVETVYTSAYKDNVRSRHALLKCGFEQLDISAREPDEQLNFYRLPTTNRQNAVTSLDYRSELAALLSAIESPIILE